MSINIYNYDSSSYPSLGDTLPVTLFCKIEEEAGLEFVTGVNYRQDIDVINCILDRTIDGAETTQLTELITNFLATFMVGDLPPAPAPEPVDTDTFDDATSDNKFIKQADLDSAGITIEDIYNIIAYTKGNPVLQPEMTYDDLYNSHAGPFDGGNSTTIYGTVLEHTFTVPVTGNYYVEFHGQYANNTTSNDMGIRMLMDDSEILPPWIIETKDSGGSGVSIPNITGSGNVNSGTNQRYPISYGRVMNLSAGSHTLRIDLKSFTWGTVASMFEVTSSVTRRI